MGKSGHPGRRNSPSRSTTADDELSILKQRASAGLVYVVGVSTGILAAAAIHNSPSIRYHDHRPAFSTAAQVLVGLLIAFAVETRLSAGSDERTQGLLGGTLFLMCIGLVASIIGTDLSAVTTGGDGSLGAVSVCFASTCAAIAAGMTGLVLVYFSKGSPRATP